MSLRDDKSMKSLIFPTQVLILPGIDVVVSFDAYQIYKRRLSFQQIQRVDVVVRTLDTMLLDHDMRKLCGEP